MPDIPETFADAVRRAYEHPVDDATAERHVAAMVREAREIAEPPSALSSVPARRRRRALRPALAVGFAALVLPCGLAAAGVHLPDPVKAPFDVVGIELPNQAPDTAEERVPRRVPASTTTTPAAERPQAPGVPDGGVREGHGADDARRGERRSEERNKGRRGDERRRENRPKPTPRPARPARPAKPTKPVPSAPPPKARPEPGPRPKPAPKVRPTPKARPAPHGARPVRPEMPEKPVKPDKGPPT